MKRAPNFHSEGRLSSYCMNDYVILTDSTSDLPDEIVKEFEIEVLPMRFSIDGKSYVDGEMSTDEFYGKMKNKLTASTSQINPGEFEEYFEKHLKLGRDIIYVCFSSGLSGTYNSACIAAKELCLRYPQNRIEIIDSLSASLGEGLLVYRLACLKKLGSSIDDLVKWADDNKLKICHWFIVDDLHHLQRGGRISHVAAIFGSMVGIKPVLHFKDDGKLYLVEKARGRERAIEIMISKLEKFGVDISDQKIFISHATCEEDALHLAEKIKSKFGVKDVIIGTIGPIIGSHTGCGTLALFFLSDKR